MGNVLHGSLGGRFCKELKYFANHIYSIPALKLLGIV